MWQYTGELFPGAIPTDNKIGTIKAIRHRYGLSLHRSKIIAEDILDPSGKEQRYIAALIRAANRLTEAVIDLEHVGYKVAGLTAVEPKFNEETRAIYLLLEITGKHIEALKHQVILRREFTMQSNEEV
jgi:ribosomal protein L7/L12